MATATKKKTKSIGQVAYLTKQVKSLEKDLIRKDIKQLKTELTAKVDKVDTKIDNLDSKVGSNNKIVLWILGSLVVLVGGGLTALLSIMLYLHSDTKQDMKELRKDINTKLDKLIERDLRK